MNNRNGKIARLPRQTREELNERLERSEPGPQLLAWLNALEEVKKIIRDEFAGVPISKQNLSEWRQGGFQEWLARQDLWAKVRDMENFAKDLGEEGDNLVADDVATVLAAHYAALISTWNGQPDAKFEAAARVLNGLCRGVVQLQRGMHRAARDNREYIQELEGKSERFKERCKKRLLDQVWAIQREPMVAKVFGGGELGRKLAKYIVAVENGELDAKLEPADEDLKKAKRPVKTGSKTKAKKADKPLMVNNLEEQKAATTSQDESSPVKLGQTDLAPISPTRPTPPISAQQQSQPEADSGPFRVLSPPLR